MPRRTLSILLFLMTPVWWSCSPSPKEADPSKASVANMDHLAKAYVMLGLQLGRLDANYVDAYYGPKAWEPDPSKAPPALEALRQQAASLLGELKAFPEPSETLPARRLLYLRKQMTAMVTRIAMLQGQKLDFDEEAIQVYDAKPPKHDLSHFQALVTQLEQVIPGEGGLRARLQAYRDRFVIPPARLDSVFKAAIEEARQRTKAHLDLPEGETFTVEYVTGKPWSGYNWYQGNATSLIQVNTEFPITIDRAIDLACHEGYPGHHVYNVLLEQHLVREKGWQEFAFYPLFSPQSLIAEGTANFGIQVAFTTEERIAFEKEVLFPLAGLDGADAAQYYKVMGLLDQLKYAGNEAARSFLNGTVDRSTAISWLTGYALMPEPKAKQRIDFFKTYRAYVINYNLGEDLVAAYVESQGGGTGAGAKWQAFQNLLSAPWVPSQLQTMAD